MKRKIVFLDIDGVLNNHSRQMNLYCGIHKDKIDLLNQVILRTNCDIVISSAWRYMVIGGEMTVKGFEYMLLSHGLRCYDRVIDVTPSDEAIQSRGKQISGWLSKNKEKFNVQEYVVVDDLSLDIESCGHPFVQTDGTVGLEQMHVEEMITILGFDNGEE
jgi:hypothetical protein